jgi:hypothetical protein
MTDQNHRTARLQELERELGTVQAFLQQDQIDSARLLVKRMQKQVRALLDADQKKLIARACKIEWLRSVS